MPDSASSTPGGSPSLAPPAGAPGTALVLGGSSDIAVAIVAELARRGLHHVVLAARGPDNAVDAAERAAPGLRCDGIAWDATGGADVHEEMAGRASTLLGRIDLVVCAVGMLGHHAGISMGPAGVEEMVATNFAGPAAALAALAPVLRRQGSGTVVVLSSVAGIRARRSNYVYGSTKAGLDAFAQGMGDALAADGVGVMVVRPGFVRSRMTEGLDPAPFHTDPETVARAVADGLARGRHTVSVPSRLGPLFAGLRNLPRPLWRRVAGDR